MTSPSPDVHAMYSWVSYGVPIEFLRITYEGCFEGQKITRNFEFLALAIDIGSFVLLGIILYIGVTQLKRFRNKSVM
jgi:hypothetical protein